MLLGWLIAGKSIPGHDTEPAGIRNVNDAVRIFVACGHAPDDVPLTEDPRVIRVQSEHIEGVMEKCGYHKTIYVIIRDLGYSDLVLEIAYSFGNVGGHTYEFDVMNVAGLIRVKGWLKRSA
jgi:hypothetical protein